MMDFDETPDSVWEDEMPDEKGGGSNEEFLFEEVTEPEPAPPAQPAETSKPTPPETGATADEAPIVFEEEKPSGDIPANEPSLFEDATPPDTPSPDIQPSQDLIYDSAGEMPAEQPAAPPVDEEPAAPTGTPPIESSPEIVPEPDHEPAPPSAMGMEQPPVTSPEVLPSEPMDEQPAAPPVQESASPREISLRISLTPEDIERGEVTLTLHIDLEPKKTP